MTLDRTGMIASIEAEIARLQEAKALLDAGFSIPKARKQYAISNEGRKRIVEAQRRRWAKVKSLRS
jgi:hypothetical protein